MIVLDASAIVEVLRGTAAGWVVVDRLAREDGDLHYPHLAVSETISVFRSLVARGDLPAATAEDGLTDLQRFPGRRYPVEPLIPRIWALRQNTTAYDAHYLALAEVLGAPLLTFDGRLATVPGHRVVVEVLRA